MKRFSDLLCMAGCKCLDLLKSFLSYASSDVRPILLSLLFTFINYKSWQMWRMAASHISSFPLSREEVAVGFQIAGFASPGLRKLHLEKTCLLVE